MEPVPLLLLLSLLRGCGGRPTEKLVVTPQQPVVQYGGSVQLNCSLPCAEGTVQWKGLDTNLGSITSFPTHSILHISSAVVAMEGTQICQGTCRGQHYQEAVNLKVYALPDTLQLDTEPQALEPGQPATLHCSAQQVYPLMGLALTWYRGDQALRVAELDPTETEEQLFNITDMLSVAGKDVGEGVEFRCEVTLSIGQETLTRVASVTASAGAVTEQPVAMATSVESPWTAAATMESPSTASLVTTTALPLEPSVPTQDPTTAQGPIAETILELAAATKPPSTERPAPRDLLTGSPTARLATTSLPSSSTTSPPAEAWGTAGDSISWGSTQAGKGMGLPVGTVPACSLRIWSLPPNGTRGRALSIECHAQCTGNATVRWLRTPVALSQYQEEVAGSSSTLRLDRAEPQHQGHYQCVLLGHRSQVVSLQLTVSDDGDSTDPAVAAGTTVSLLGLIVTSVVSHRLWKRFRSQYELS
ncbi:PREDICTED: mucosal addressin cell adhesion molecule 1 [Calidris pugnax]|uniref:mucosal addressin cell adhesion molecule 1 n=1 Tax=Calidris pugnax TaxID=198806 RepID=UPI00071DDAE9|nr:PREDICTED: mucosal addressin cell adhesion molecule 1 [Calidris pugnax]